MFLSKITGLHWPLFSTQPGEYCCKNIATVRMSFSVQPYPGGPAGIKGIEDMVGLFINTIPLRTQTIPGEKIIDVVFRTDQGIAGT